MYADPAAYPLEAVPLSGSQRGTYVIRPKGQLGTIGWFPYPWAAEFVKAPTPALALQRAWQARADQAAAERTWQASAGAQ